MDFVSASFPGTRIHLQLYEIAGGKQQNVAAAQLEQRKTALASLASTYQQNFTIINATYVASIMHLNIAISRALISQRDGKMKTTSLGNEIVYFMHP